MASEITPTSKIDSDVQSGLAKENVLFSASQTISHLKHYLPTQTPLRDFIHHNTLHAFQKMKFYDAIFKASKIFGYQVTLQLCEFRQLHENGRISDDVLNNVIRKHKGDHALKTWRENVLSKIYDTTVSPRVGQLRARWKSRYKLDLDSLVHPILFRILSNYLDQGISIWSFPVREGGFLQSVRRLEQNSFTSFFRSRRAKKLLLETDCAIEDLLRVLVGNSGYFEQYLFDQQFSHQGWSGIVSAVEDQPHSLLDRRVISLNDLIVFELLLEIDALESELGNDWRPLCADEHSRPADLFENIDHNEILDVFRIWQDAFEWSYYDQVLAGIIGRERSAPVAGTTFQAFFCIDERECSLRRHIEATDPNCETFGTPGFFGVEFYFQPEHGSFYDKLCPAPVTPKFLIKEYDVKEKRHSELLYSKATNSGASALLMTLSLGFFAGVRMLLNLFRPKMSPAISNAFGHMFRSSKLKIENDHPDQVENGLQVGFTVPEMAQRVESVLRGIGLTKNFAPVIYVVAHGSSSANNPHHGAHDCGACSGRPGSVNSRVFAFMANHPKVRAILQSRSIEIGAQTRFIGALHDTAADQIQYYDDDQLGEEISGMHRNNQAAFEKALDLNAKERSRRFASINTRMPLSRIRKAIRDRSVSLFEPRPELGHGTNSLCIVGSRQLTKKLFLDRRAFLNSYDCRTDPEGKLLSGIMKPLGPVCGGISLEYYFSRVDNHKLGAGTKLPHNVVGLFGVTNSADGDLRPGLPLQMIEVHDPVRLLIIVEHFPDVVLRTIQAVPEMYEWFINEWVHLAVLNPDTNTLHYFKDGAFSDYQPLLKNVSAMEDFDSLIEGAKEMETNKIADATLENLPVLVLK